MKNWNLEHKKAFVTGGSKGIGKAVVSEFVALGAEVLFTGRNESDLLAAQQEFQSQGFKTHILSGSVTDAAHRSKIANWITSNWGKLDILVNNAGINIRKPTKEYTAEEYLRVMDTDLIAPFEFCRILFPVLQKSGKSSIINIASVAGSFDVQTGAPYGMAKSGLIQLSRNLASEWARYGILVNSVSPWFTSTPLTKEFLAQPEKVDKITARTPLNRIANDEEIAAAVAFLSMDKASYITGQNLSVDGGVTTSLL
jgi:Tropinone reductase 1